MSVEGGIVEVADDVSPCLNAAGRQGLRGARNLDGSENSVAQQEAVRYTVGVDVGSDNVAPSVDAMAFSCNGVGNVNSHEAIVARK